MVNIYTSSVSALFATLALMPLSSLIVADMVNNHALWDFPMS
jgi:hypothetical protein